MGRRVLVGTVATLGLVALVGMFAALSLLFSSPGPAYAQTNSAPQFSSDAITLVVDEYTDVSEGSTPWYRSIGTPVTATDADDDKLTYTLENVTTSYFTIHGKTGQLEVGPPLDYEDPNDRTHTVKVIATDPSGESDTITVKITVTNVEEPGRVSLYWDQPQVLTSLKATLTDPDGGITGKSWTWSSSDFKTGPYTEISTATLDTYTPVANDVDKYLRARVSYTDGHDPGKTADTVSVRAVRAAPETNSAPAFDKDHPGGYGCPINGEPGICRHISRSTPVGYYIYYPFRATDPIDRHEIRYSLAGTKADSFHIDPSRGDLFTTEANVWGDSAFTITITATDPSAGTDDIKVKLTPSGGKLNPAVEGPSKITYPENGTWPLATYIATRLRHTSDGEGEGPIRTTGWIISVEPGGGDGDFFRMNDDGLLTFIQPPDYDDPADENGDNRYSFSITAYDGNPPPGERPGQSFYNVTVTVVNVEETLEIRGPSVVNHPENSREVSTYTLPEANGPVTWSVSGTDGEWFSINGGVLTFHRSPDYENPTDLDGGGDKGDQPDNAYLVAITVEDNTNIKTEHVRVQVTNVNESPTFDNDLETTFSVDPDAAVNDLVGDLITATDPDGNGLTYSLPDVDTLPFKISEYTGQLAVSGPIDENRASYAVAVIVTDNDPDDSEDDRIIVTVNVGDGGGSNNAPAFPATETGARSIAENTATVKNVGAPVTAEDDDTDDTLSYTLGGTDGGFFTIVSTSGQIQTMTQQTYDFETKPTYSVTVTANDNNGGTATKDVTITLTDLDEAGTVTLPPTQPVARVDVTAILADPDNGVTNVSWQWSKSDSQNGTYANISSATSATYTPADEDVGKFLKATASYTDVHGPNKSVEATTSAVQSGTNRAPDFGDLTATRDVAENTAANGNVGAVVGATDLDSDDLAYSLTSTDASSFTVDNTGQIKVGATTMLDYESAKNTYTVVVQVTDSKDAAGDTETNPTNDDIITVTINVTNVNEDGTVNLSMTQPSVRTEITATLTDPDGGVTGESWVWARTTDPTDLSAHPWVNITNATSASYAPVDGDVNYYLQATVSYTDAEASGKSAKAETTQAVRAGANRAPTFASGTVTLTVPENSGADVNVGSPVIATDLDAGNTLEYSLEGTDKDSFKIVSDSGQIQTKSGVTYDYETKASYSVTVKADDGNSGTATATKAVTITLTNVEEAGTVRLSPTQPAARQAVTATLTDPDEVSGTPTWQWQRSSDGNSGWANVGSNSSSYTPPDADLNYYLQATATYIDGQGSGKTATAKTVGPVQAGTNRAPTFDDGKTTSRDVVEDAAATANVGAVVGATDLDSDDLTYSLTSTDASSFTVDNTGQIKVGATTTLDHESAKNTYTVVVQVTDSKDPAGDTETNPTIDDNITVTINVTDGDVGKFLKAKVSYTDAETSGKTAEAVSDNAVGSGENRAPDFGAATDTRSFAEDTAANTDIGDAVTAADADDDSLAYSLNATGATFFDIDITSGQIKTKSGVTYDHETTPSYSVTVTAADGNSGTATIDVTITVTDVEEVGTVTLPMTQPLARTQLTATLTDPDGGVTGTTWKWARSDAQDGTYIDISSATSATYTPADEDVDKFLRATASYEDSRGSGKSAAAVSANAVGSGANRAPDFGATNSTREFPESRGPGLGGWHPGKGHGYRHQRCPQLHTGGDRRVFLRDCSDQRPD